MLNGTMIPLHGLSEMLFDTFSRYRQKPILDSAATCSCPAALLYQIAALFISFGVPKAYS